MPITTLRPARPFATALAVAALITTGAACSSSSPKASGSTTPTSSSNSSKSTNPTTQAPPQAKTTGDTPNPCTIVTAAEVQAIIGTAAQPVGPKSEHRGTVCNWGRGTGSSLLVQVYRGKEFYDPSIQAPTAKKIAGLGDDAYLDAFGTTRAEVGFLKGDIAVFIDGLEITSSDAVVAAARDAASKA